MKYYKKIPIDKSVPGWDANTFRYFAYQDKTPDEALSLLQPYFNNIRTTTTQAAYNTAVAALIAITTPTIPVADSGTIWQKIIPATVTAYTRNGLDFIA